MDSKLLVAVVVVVVIAAVAYMLVSGGGQRTATPTATVQGGGQAPPTPGGGSVRLLGSGSTFVKPAMDKWISEFHKNHPNVVIDYTGGGSGKGVSDIVQGLVDFAGSDPPLPKKIWEKNKGKLLQFPVILGAVVITYNVPEIGNVQLNFTGEVLAKIYMGEIRYWDDPAIKQLNPAVADKLPHAEIIAVHRSDASGTTQIFTTFLAKSCKEWGDKVGYGKTIDWPVDKTGRGIGAEGNQGVTQAVKNNKYSIGYIEWAYAIRYSLPVARIENPAGNFVAPSKESISAAFALENPPSPADDWTSVAKSFVYSDASPLAYPIAGQTFLIVKASYSGAKCQAMKDFIKYIVTDGQDVIPDGYAPLPDSLRQVGLRAADMIECSG